MRLEYFIVIIRNLKVSLNCFISSAPIHLCMPLWWYDIGPYLHRGIQLLGWTLSARYSSFPNEGLKEYFKYSMGCFHCEFHIQVPASKLCVPIPAQWSNRSFLRTEIDKSLILRCLGGINTRPSRYSQFMLEKRVVYHLRPLSHVLTVWPLSFD